VSKKNLAYLYARAAFEYAKAQAIETSWREFLKQASSLIETVSREHRVLFQQLSWGEWLKLYESLSERPLLESEQRFFSLLHRSKRLELLPEIQILYELLRSQSLGVLVVKVSSAQTLSAAEIQTLQKSLETKFLKSIELKFQVDPSLIAGLRLQIGDWVLDNTIKNRLDQLRQTLGETHATIRC